jgi:hypothetical protein
MRFPSVIVPNLRLVRLFAALLAVFFIAPAITHGAHENIHLWIVDAPSDAESPVVDSIVDDIMPGAEDDGPLIEPTDAIDADDFAGPSRLAAQDGANEPLIDRVVDPTAWLMELRLRQQWTWPVDDNPDLQVLQFRPTIPYVAFRQVHLLRVSVPYNIEGDDAPGLGDVQMFDLAIFKEDWGRWGIGPSVRLIPNTDGEGSTFLAGPAGGATTKTNGWTLGFLIQNFLGEDESQSRIQPILALKLNEDWALNIGESEFRYDWDEGRWTQVPLGIQVNNISMLCGQKVQFFVNPQYNFVRDSNTSGWTLYVGLALLVPEANR